MAVAVLCFLTHAVRGVHEVVSHGGDVGGHEPAVEDVAARQHEGGRVQQALQLTVRHQGSCIGSND
jgi:hypothetical protein